MTDRTDAASAGETPIVRVVRPRLWANLIRGIVNISLCAWLLIDTATGFLMARGSGLAAVPRSMKVVLFAVFVATLVRRSDGLVTALSLAALFSASLLILLTQGPMDLRTIEIVVKLQLPIVASGALMIVNGSYASAWSRRIIVVNAMTLLGNLALAVSGIGLPTYVTPEGVTVGGSGFFYAGNEVSGAILFCFAGLMLFYGNSIGPLLLSFASMGMAATALLSRAALMGTAVIGTTFLFVRSRTAFVAMIVLLVGLILRFTEALFLPFRALWARWSFFINEYGFRTFLLGGAKRLEGIEQYVSSVAASPITLITGTGWDGSIENNVFDLLQAFGIVGAVVLMIWMALLFPEITRAVMGRAVPKDGAPFIVASTMLLATLVGAGHIVQSTMIVPFAAVYFARGIEVIARGQRSNAGVVPNPLATMRMRTPAQ